MIINAETAAFYQPDRRARVRRARSDSKSDSRPAAGAARADKEAWMRRRQQAARKATGSRQRKI